MSGSRYRCVCHSRDRGWHAPPSASACPRSAGLAAPSPVVGRRGRFVVRVGVPAGAMPTAPESDEARERRESVSRTAEPSHHRIRPVAPEKCNRVPLRSSRASGNMTGEEATPYVCCRSRRFGSCVVSGCSRPPTMRKRMSVSSPGIDVDVEVACKGKRRSGLVSIEGSVGDPVPSQFFFRDLDGNRFLIVQSELSVPRFRARYCSGAWCGRPSRDASGYPGRRWRSSRAGVRPPRYHDGGRP